MSESAQLTTWQRRGLYGLLVVVVLFGGLVEFRTAFLHRRMGDLEVFLRTAWAVRAGADIYVVTDSKGFHYHYPPLFAVVMTPLADAPPGAPRPWMLPFGVSVLIWYGLSLACVCFAVQGIAGVLEKNQPAPRFTRRWWALRVLPALACLPAVGGSLMRGQVDALLLLLLSGMIVAAVRRQGFRAGLWLAGAICLKVIPAFLLIYPVWRRDYRWLAGCTVGLLVGLLLVPLAVFGPRQTVAYYREWHEVLVQPALAEGGNQSRARELIDVTATDSQSFLAVIHNTLHLDRSRRPAVASIGVRLAHWSLGGALTLLLLLASNSGRQTAADEVVLLGGLIVLMLLLSPVCHLHYFALVIPLAAGLLAHERTDRRLLVTFFAVNVLANILPRVPGMELLRDTGLAMYASLALWLIGCTALATRQPASLPAFAARAR